MAFEQIFEPSFEQIVLRKFDDLNARLDGLYAMFAASTRASTDHGVRSDDTPHGADIGDIGDIGDIADIGDIGTDIDIFNLGLDDDSDDGEYVDIEDLDFGELMDELDVELALEMDATESPTTESPTVVTTEAPVHSPTEAPTTQMNTLAMAHGDNDAIANANAITNDNTCIGIRKKRKLDSPSVCNERNSPKLATATPTLAPSMATATAAPSTAPSTASSTAGWAQIGTRGTEWNEFFAFSPSSRVIRASIAMTARDTIPTMVIYIRDAKALFMIRDGHPTRLSGNWRRMHIRTRAVGVEEMGATMESAGAQKMHVVPYRGSLLALVESALGPGRSVADLDHIPIY